MTIWSPEDVAEARRLWDEKNLSALQIAKLFGYTTRNAVVGLAHRRGWPNRSECRTPHYFGGREVKEAKPPKPRVRAPRPVVRPVVLKVDPLPVMDGRSPHAKPFMLTRRNECRWALGAASEPAHAMMMVCGAVTVEGRPYCERHCRAAGSGYTNRRIRPPFESTVRPSVWA